MKKQALKSMLIKVSIIQCESSKTISLVGNQRKDNHLVDRAFRFVLFNTPQDIKSLREISVQNLLYFLKLNK